MDVTSYLLGKKKGGGGGSLQTKSVTITSNGTSSVQPDTGYSGLSKVNITTNVTPNLETKSITITENGTTTLTPTSGKDGMSSVSITTNVSGGGTYKVQDGIKFGYCTFFPTNVDFSEVTTFEKMFYGTSFTTIPLIDTSNGTTFNDMFRLNTKLTSVPQIDTSKAILCNDMFYNCSNLEDVPILNWSNMTNDVDIFKSCGKLTDNSLNNILYSLLHSGVTTLSWKKLSRVGFSSAQITRCHDLSNYQALIDAGWTDN